MKKKYIKQKSLFLKKKIYILSDCFIPTRNSASGMIYNLSKSLMKDGALVTCVHSGKNPNNNALAFKDYDLEGLNFITSISAAATAISNVGPGLGDLIGPNGNFSALSDFSKWILSFAMILGRLELFAILVLFVPSFWKKY